MAFIKIGIPEFGGAKTAPGTIPVAETLTGTISHTNNALSIIGIGTKFTSELQVGQYIYANNIVIKVTGIRDDLYATIEKTFGTTFSAQPVKMCRAGVYRYIRIDNAHASAVGKIQGNFTLNDIPAGKFVEFTEEAGLAPLAYDGTGSTLLVSTMQ